jgi:RNA polymerase sigma factor (sigma-70 family)
LEEKELIQRCVKLDAVAQRILFDEYCGRLMTICRRYSRDQPEAEDMLQESFIRIFRFIGKFNFNGSFEGWLRKITVRSAIQFLQKRQIKFTDLPHAPDRLDTGKPLISSQLDAEDLLKVIATLSEGYRTVFNLYVIDGYSHEEIAQLLNIEIATSRSQLSKAREILRKKLNLFHKISD